MKIFDFARYLTWCAENRMRPDYMTIVFDGHPIRRDCTGKEFVAAKGDFLTVFDCWCANVDEDEAKSRQFGHLLRFEICFPFTLHCDCAEKDDDENIALQEYIAREEVAIFKEMMIKEQNVTSCNHMNEDEMKDYITSLVKHYDGLESNKEEDSEWLSILYDKYVEYSATNR